jgi:hypothetical protein
MTRRFRHGVAEVTRRFDPSDMQPGRSGTIATKPPPSSSKSGSTISG